MTAGKKEVTFLKLGIVGKGMKKMKTTVNFAVSKERYDKDTCSLTQHLNRLKFPYFDSI